MLFVECCWFGADCLFSIACCVVCLHGYVCVLYYYFGFMGVVEFGCIGLVSLLVS